MVFITHQVIFCFFLKKFLSATRNYQMVLTVFNGTWLFSKIIAKICRGTCPLYYIRIYSMLYMNKRHSFGKMCHGYQTEAILLLFFGEYLSIPNIFLGKRH